MSSIAPEVKLIHFKFDRIRTDAPFVQYHIMSNDKPKAIDVYDRGAPATINYEVKSVPVVTFSRITPPISFEPFGRGTRHDTHLALTHEAQQVVDLFVNEATKEKMYIIGNLQDKVNSFERALKEERSMSLWQCFKRWFNTPIGKMS